MIVLIMCVLLHFQAASEIKSPMKKEFKEISKVRKGFDWWGYRPMPITAPCFLFTREKARAPTQDYTSSFPLQKGSSSFQIRGSQRYVLSGHAAWVTVTTQSSNGSTINYLIHFALYV